MRLGECCQKTDSADNYSKAYMFMKGKNTHMKLKNPKRSKYNY